MAAYRRLILRLISIEERIPVLITLIVLFLTTFVMIFFVALAQAAAAAVPVVGVLFWIPAAAALAVGAPITWLGVALIADQMWSAVGIYTLFGAQKHAMRERIKRWVHGSSGPISRSDVA